MVVDMGTIRFLLDGLTAFLDIKDCLMSVMFGLPVKWSVTQTESIKTCGQYKGNLTRLEVSSLSGWLCTIVRAIAVMASFDIPNKNVVLMH